MHIGKSLLLYRFCFLLLPARSLNFSSEDVSEVVKFMSEEDTYTLGVGRSFVEDIVV